MNWNQGADQFLEALSSSEPTPGGGAAAAMSGAMGCALLLMAIGTTLKRKRTPEEHKAPLHKFHHDLLNRQQELKILMQQDAQAYEAYVSAQRLPAQDVTRAEKLQQALWQAALVPAEIATRTKQTLQEIPVLTPFIAPIILSDVRCAQHLLKSAWACSVENIQINLQGITNPSRAEKLKQLLASLKEGMNHESNPA